ncbi:hypothetical protein N7457_003786 [Penicillium paradoxum]|uniref:uncharacterized protein n=1 Tax=Penicillium paradoxum TaxID=176176 RepID=UPI002546F368|nr:uncharacterized protein N7457_003786 [Penicillium paradoxum]KAJ5782012.1 hypothetical protein N7457_003786 [Penicillium paradoxum]
MTLLAMVGGAAAMTSSSSPAAGPTGLSYPSGFDTKTSCRQSANYRKCMCFTDMRRGIRHSGPSIGNAWRISRRNWSIIAKGANEKMAFDALAFLNVYNNSTSRPKPTFHTTS